MAVTGGRTYLADTSIFVALESGREITGDVPSDLAVSMVTVAELRLGVLNAQDVTSRVQRLATLQVAEALEPFVVDSAVANAWAELRVRLRQAGKKLAANDSWIAATAIAHGLPLATQDDDYADVPGLEVLRL